ncbi:hypothetical protein G4B88_017363 [Cannabis sativa]|uniref:DUF1985 domain-containing protein n=1 Tax=Cannabis sativa TaxID=3483 RepID=A0A7J6ESR4_CANSA|nr:hypothetical protein G4B88_017363 [Cannabis sativa]
MVPLRRFQSMTRPTTSLWPLPPYDFSPPPSSPAPSTTGDFVPLHHPFCNIKIYIGQNFQLKVVVEEDLGNMQHYSLGVVTTTLHSLISSFQITQITSPKKTVLKQLSSVSINEDNFKVVKLFYCSVANMTKVSPMKKARRASSSRHRGGKKNVIFQDVGPEKFSSDDSRIHVTCHWHGFNCIKEFLSDLQLQKLRESCFGYLFDLDESLKPAQMIMHSLLLHQECNSNGNELQLSFNSNKVKFSIVEFGIITGLNCNEFPPDSDIIEHPNRLLNKYFSGNESISRKELAECLMKTRIDDDDDVVKLTKNILQSKRGQCHVDNFVMKLVDDEQMFEKYPWGRRSFNDTVNSLSTVLNRRKTGYEICGFPLAFQVLGFEILPSLGSSFAIKVGNNIPKILNWKMTNLQRSSRLKIIWKEVFGKNKITCVPLAPVDDNRSTTAEQIGLNHDSSSPRMNDRRTNLQKEIEDLMKESASLKALNVEIREENVEIKKENAEIREKITEIREKITEITNENCGLKDEIAAVRKQVDVFMQYFTDLLELKTSFKNIEKLVLWLAENGGTEKRTCGEKENAKESDEDLVFLNESKNTFSRRNFHECTNELKSSNTVFSGPDCHPNVAEILQDSNVKIHQMKEGQQDKEANEGSRSMDHVNDEDKEVVEANKSGKAIIESDDDVPTFNLLSQSFSENENEPLCETLKVLRSKRKRKTTLSRYLISPFEPLNKPKGAR